MFITVCDDPGPTRKPIRPLRRRISTLLARPGQRVEDAIRDGVICLEAYRQRREARSRQDRQGVPGRRIP